MAVFNPYTGTRDKPRLGATWMYRPQDTQDTPDVPIDTTSNPFVGAFRQSGAPGGMTRGGAGGLLVPPRDTLDGDQRVYDAPPTRGGAGGLLVPPRDTGNMNPPERGGGLLVPPRAGNSPSIGLPGNPPRSSPVFNPGASPFQAGTMNNSLEKDALGYGDGGETAITKDYAWNRWLNAWSPYLTSRQRAQVQNMRGTIQASQSDAQYQSGGSTRFGDVLGGTDLIRNIIEATPSERGQYNRYAPTRYRES